MGGENIPTGHSYIGTISNNLEIEVTANYSTYDMNPNYVYL